MTKLLLIALAASVATISAPVIAQAAKAKPGECNIHPQDFRAQCFMELGGWCDPVARIVRLEGPSGGSVLGEARVQACVDQKRAQARRR